MNRNRDERTRIEHVEAAARSLLSAHRDLIDATADFGTPDEITAGKAFVRAARAELNALLGKHGRKPVQ